MADEFKTVFKRNLRAQLELRDMTREELAARSGLSLYSVEQYARGETQPLLGSAYAIATALGCTVNDLCAAPPGVAAVQ